jgi:hypothetical protein
VPSIGTEDSWAILPRESVFRDVKDVT